MQLEAIRKSLESVAEGNKGFSTVLRQETLDNGYFISTVELGAFLVELDKFFYSLHGDETYNYETKFETIGRTPEGDWIDVTRAATLELALWNHEKLVEKYKAIPHENPDGENASGRDAEKIH